MVKHVTPTVLDLIQMCKCTVYVCLLLHFKKSSAGIWACIMHAL